MTTLVQDARYALRTLRTQPGFTAVVVLTLALGIGANTAIFSVIHGVLLTPLPFAEPDRLYLAYQSLPEQGMDTIPLSPANFADWRRDSTLFEDLVAFNGGSFNLTGADVPECLKGMHVSAGYFRLLRSPPQQGRGFLPEEDVDGAPPVVVLSHRLWQRRFGGDPAILGTAIELNDEPYTVVGIAEEGFNFPAQTDLWTPNRFDPAIPRDDSYVLALGRLKPGVDAAAADAELKRIAARLEADYPQFNQGVTARLISLQERVVARVKPALLVLSGAVAFVLLIACANVASLLLSRAAARRKEVAIRLALGAGRSRLLGQFLTESVLLSAAGGALGVLLAAWGTDALVAIQAGAIPRAAGIGMNATVLGFALALSLLTGLILTLVPAFQLRDAELGDPLREAGRGVSGGARDGRARGAFVAAEVALALILLIGASLMLRSFAELARVDLGFRPGGLMTFELNLPEARYDADRKLVDFYDAALSQVRALPGVEAAAAIYPLPLSGELYGEALLFEGRPRPEVARMPVSHVRMVSPGYFEAMEIPVLNGRRFGGHDDRAGAPVAIINRTLAEEHFAGENPIGRRLAIFDATQDEQRWLEVVGVVGDVRHEELAHLAEPELYLPLAQKTAHAFSLVVRSAAAGTPAAGTPAAGTPAAGTPAAGTPAEQVRHAVGRVDPEVPLFHVASMDQLVDDSLAGSRFLTVLLGFFSSVALTLAVIGVYGVLSYWVSRRTREIGIRMVLGVSRRRLTSMVVGQGMVPVAAGVVLGLAGAFAVTRFLASQLYGVSSTDPVTFGVVAAVLVAVAIGATLIPARRAAAVNPVAMLRDE